MTSTFKAQESDALIFHFQGKRYEFVYEAVGAAYICWNIGDWATWHWASAIYLQGEEPIKVVAKHLITLPVSPLPAYLNRNLSTEALLGDLVGALSRLIQNREIRVDELWI